MRPVRKVFDSSTPSRSLYAELLSDPENFNEHDPHVPRQVSEGALVADHDASESAPLGPASNGRPPMAPNVYGTSVSQASEIPLSEDQSPPGPPTRRFSANSENRLRRIPVDVQEVMCRETIRYDEAAAWTRLRHEYLTEAIEIVEVLKQREEQLLVDTIVRREQKVAQAMIHMKISDDEGDELPFSRKKPETEVGEDGEAPHELDATMSIHHHDTDNAALLMDLPMEILPIHAVEVARCPPSPVAGTGDGDEPHTIATTGGSCIRKSIEGIETVDDNDVIDEIVYVEGSRRKGRRGSKHGNSKRKTSRDGPLHQRRRHESVDKSFDELTTTVVVGKEEDETTQVSEEAQTVVASLLSNTMPSPNLAPSSVLSTMESLAEDEAMLLMRLKQLEGFEARRAERVALKEERIATLGAVPHQHPDDDEAHADVLSKALHCLLGFERLGRDCTIAEEERQWLVWCSLFAIEARTDVHDAEEGGTSVGHDKDDFFAVTTPATLDTTSDPTQRTNPVDDVLQSPNHPSLSVKRAASCTSGAVSENDEDAAYISHVGQMLSIVKDEERLRALIGIKEDTSYYRKVIVPLREVEVVWRTTTRARRVSSALEKLDSPSPRRRGSDAYAAAARDLQLTLAVHRLAEQEGDTRKKIEAEWQVGFEGLQHALVLSLITGLKNSSRELQTSGELYEWSTRTPMPPPTSMLSTSRGPTRAHRKFFATATTDVQHHRSVDDADAMHALALRAESALASPLLPFIGGGSRSPYPAGHAHPSTTYPPSSPMPAARMMSSRQQQPMISSSSRAHHITQSTVYSYDSPFSRGGHTTGHAVYPHHASYPSITEACMRLIRLEIQCREELQDQYWKQMPVRSGTERREGAGMDDKISGKWSNQGGVSSTLSARLPSQHQGSHSFLSTAPLILPIVPQTQRLTLLPGGGLAAARYAQLQYVRR